MLLAKYPGAIATLELQVLQMTKEIESLLSQVKNIEVEIDLAIALNADYKNDTQRKGVKSQALQAHKSYGTLIQTLNIQQGQKGEKQIQLTKTINEFSVAKLEMQFDIATMNKMAA